MNARSDFAGFFGGLSPTLKAIAFKLNRGLCSLDEHDLYQEAAVYLWQRFNNGDLADKTRSYILQACYFHLQNFIRTSKDRIHRVAIDAGHDDEGEARVEAVDLPGPGREELLEAIDTKLLADIIINNGLTDKEKRLLPLFAEGLTTREIGSRVGLSHVRIVKMKKVIGDKCRKYLDLQA